MRKEVFNVEATRGFTGKDTIGDVEGLREIKRTGHYRPYDEFTKKFDETSHNLPLRK